MTKSLSRNLESVNVLDGTKYLVPFEKVKVHIITIVMSVTGMKIVWNSMARRNFIMNCHIVRYKPFCLVSISEFELQMRIKYFPLKFASQRASYHPGDIKTW